MEKSIITSGKTIDLAVASALSQLGLDRDSVSVTVLQQAKSGFLGFGAQPAKVQVTYEVPDPVPEKEEKPKSALGSASRSKPKAPAAPVKKPEAPQMPKAEPPKPAPVPAPKPEKPRKSKEKPSETERRRKKRLARRIVWGAVGVLLLAAVITLGTIGYFTGLIERLTTD
ncbi:MAG: hypothetical protein EGQ10_00510, partial [Clostridiales bacterium]|nr:hypothetical protein [Clostridiales bacterium]